MKVLDGVPLNDGTIKLSEDGRCLILEDGRRLHVNLNDADIVKSATITVFSHSSDGPNY